MRKIVVSIVLLAMVAIACSPNPYARTNKAYRKQAKTYAGRLREMPPANSMDDAAYWVGTTNFSMRKPNYVVIHHTAQNSCEQTLKTFTLTRTQVSAHYVICRDGTIHHMLNDYLRAHHAGLARWGNNTDLNSSSIGIELDNNGFESFDERQVNSLLRLLDTLKVRHNIPAANFIGHGDIAPTRKNDPNWRFPWKQLADKGFGHWYRDTTGLVVPEYFDHLQALKIVGFDTKDSSAAILAFKRHWLQDTIPGMTEPAKKILYSLQQQY
ncbi:N-acetylmuramoyl-L-alanine amidase [Flavihumibacter rivuli]|uniref:N-acetylmuramoyl-L-alanine amidase n=1 Tax=Flavihumibacter rivuli TaxID=2838156 RepID=UPI001BDDF8E1|nr:N-acetylmuramoyl-L-alanine amidase [Flavihumibacter rivuli]ULQ56206.1 N-acetylmuramoyl-L-alanine amidase [Flavihumibacter rivuli]